MLKVCGRAYARLPKKKKKKNIVSPEVTDFVLEVISSTLEVETSAGDVSTGIKYLQP